MMREPQDVKVADRCIKRYREGAIGSSGGVTILIFSPAVRFVRPRRAGVAGIRSPQSPSFLLEPKPLAAGGSCKTVD